MSFSYLDFLGNVANEDIAHLKEKEKTYGDSWKKRGGVGAFMMLARKWDRIEKMLSSILTVNRHREGKSNEVANQYNIFEHIAIDPTGADSTVLAEVRDLRRYLILVEAEMMSRGVLPGYPPHRPGTPEDGGHHARHKLQPGETWLSNTCSGDTR